MTLGVSNKRSSRSSSPTFSFIVLASGVFFFYIIHDAIQERLFRIQGFEFGSFMTVMELGAMSFGSLLSHLTATTSVKTRKSGDLLPPLSVLLLYAALVVLIALSQTSGSQALNYVNFPVKVCFKSAKVLPTMAFSIFINNRKYPTIQYIAALCLVLALILMSLADYQAEFDDKHSSKHSTGEMFKGFQLLTIATLFDAVVPNIQERLLSKLQIPLDEMMFWSNVGALFLLGIVTLMTGEMSEAVAFCVLENPTAGLLLCIQAFSAFLGLRLYLTIIKRFGGVAGVMTTSARKGVTLVLSYALFHKPLTLQHILGMGSLLAGFYFSVKAKRHKAIPTVRVA